MTDKEGEGVGAGKCVWVCVYGGIQFIYYLLGQEELISETAEEERRMRIEKYFNAIGDEVIFITAPLGMFHSMLPQQSQLTLISC